jgi:hypothetical protein
MNLDCKSKAEWHAMHVKLLFLGATFGSCVGQVLNVSMEMSLQLTQAVSCCFFIAMAHRTAWRAPYVGKNWF